MKGEPTNRKKVDATVCMVVSCERPALYRSGYPRTKGRGYCAAHKHLAQRTQQTIENSAEWAAK